MPGAIFSDRQQNNRRGKIEMFAEVKELLTFIEGDGKTDRFVVK